MMKFVILAGLFAFTLADKHGDSMRETELREKIGKANDVEMDEFRQSLKSGAAEEGVELIINESNKELKKELLDLPKRGMEHFIKAMDMAKMKNRSDADEDMTDDEDRMNDEDEDRTNEIVSKCKLVEWLNETNEPCGMDDQEKELDD